jgi:hypothetical protein
MVGLVMSKNKIGYGNYHSHNLLTIILTWIAYLLDGLINIFRSPTP